MFKKAFGCQKAIATAAETNNNSNWKPLKCILQAWQQWYIYYRQMYSYVVAMPLLAPHTLCNIFAMVPSTEILVLGIALAASQLVTDVSHRFLCAASCQLVSAVSRWFLSAAFCWFVSVVSCRLFASAFYWLVSYVSHRFLSAMFHRLISAALRRFRSRFPFLLWW